MNYLILTCLLMVLTIQPLLFYRVLNKSIKKQRASISQALAVFIIPATYMVFVEQAIKALLDIIMG